MSIRRDLLMRTALLRMPEVLMAERIATATPQPVPVVAPLRVTTAPPRKRRQTKARTPAM